MMIATITLNPALDKTVTVRKLVVDDVNRWVTLRRDPAGKGIDVSRVIHRLGGETIAYGFMGGHDGKAVENLLRREGVKFDFIPIRHETRTNIIITDLETYQQTRINAPGPRVSAQELGRFMNRMCRLHSRLDFLVISGSVPPGVPNDIYAQLIREAKSKGVKTVLDSDDEWMREGVKAKPYLIKPNVKETERLLGVGLPAEEDIVHAALKLAGMGIAIVVISRGKDGLIATDGNKVFRVISPQVKAKSTTGAGDSTVAGIVLKLSQGTSLEEACRFGAAAGTAAVLTPATELCRRRDVERLFPQVKAEEISLSRQI